MTAISCSGLIPVYLIYYCPQNPTAIFTSEVYLTSTTLCGGYFNNRGKISSVFVVFIKTALNAIDYTNLSISPIKLIIGGDSRTRTYKFLL